MQAMSNDQLIRFGKAARYAAEVCSPLCYQENTPTR
jgi:hypothetical protein